MDVFGFAKNMDSTTFAGTDFNAQKVNMTDDGTVFTVNFVAPTAPGKYAVNFDTLEVYDADMTKLIPKTTNGWIEVIDETEPETEFRVIPTV